MGDSKKCGDADTLATYTLIQGVSEKITKYKANDATFGVLLVPVAITYCSA